MTYARKRRRKIPERVKCGDMEIEILGTQGHTKYLGRKLSFSDYHRVEVENRISTAWRKFYLLKQELTGSKYPLSDRLRLFQGTVTPTVLYGCEAWTLTTDLENRLRRTQRQMLRMIIHLPRRNAGKESTTTQPATTPQEMEGLSDSGSDVDSNYSVSLQQLPEVDTYEHDVYGFTSSSLEYSAPRIEISSIISIAILVRRVPNILVYEIVVPFLVGLGVPVPGLFEFLEVKF